MGKKKSQQDLGRRERQIMGVIYQLEEASVAEVLKTCPILRVIPPCGP